MKRLLKSTIYLRMRIAISTSMRVCVMGMSIAWARMDIKCNMKMNLFVKVLIIKLCDKRCYKIRE